MKQQAKGAVKKQAGRQKYDNLRTSRDKGQLGYADTQAEENEVELWEL